MDNPRTFRECISNSDTECLVYGADNLSQFTRSNGHIRSKCDRALPAARPEDIVVLRGKPDRAYQSWLRSLGLGTDHVVAYGCSTGKTPLSRLIADNPEPVKAAIRKLNKKPVYVPWFSGNLENAAAQALGADLFGAPGALTWRHNEKSMFKTICRQLDIPVVEDTLFRIRPDNPENPVEMEKIIRHYLKRYSMVLIRGTLDNTGVSLVFKTRGDDINAVYRQLSGHGVGHVLIEPFLEVISSPNDQWIITRKGEITHLGMRDQVCKSGIHHVATIKRREPSSEEDRIKEISFKIVQHLAEANYVGVTGIDYIVTASGIYPVENNARFNGSSYVSLIVANAEELTGPVPCWKFIKTRTSPCPFNALSRQLAPVLFDGLKQESVFPYNCDHLEKTGEFAVILMGGSPDQIAALEATLGELGVG
ncbi:MAG: hypothetical protein GY737_32670 [Desulfobacteraceae bacterium]|nr:hypothetical protein [Desulfobacteraceae bacterium]